MANQNIDGLWLFALIVILTGGGGKPAGVEIRRRRAATAAGEAQTLGQFVVISF